MKKPVDIALEFGKMDPKERELSHYLLELTDEELDASIVEFQKSRYTPYWSNLFKMEKTRRDREMKLGGLGI